MLKPVDISLICPILLLNKSLEGRESILFLPLSPLVSSTGLFYVVAPSLQKTKETILYNFSQQQEFTWPRSKIYRASPVCLSHLSGSVFASVNICETNKKNICLSSSPFKTSVLSFHVCVPVCIALSVLFPYLPISVSVCLHLFP